MKRDEAVHKEHVSPIYSVYEVAQIAATLFAGRGPELLEDGTYIEVAAAAVALLDACDDELRWKQYLRDCRDDALDKQAMLNKQQTELAEEYPTGTIPWTKGLMWVTNKRSEVDGMPLFRRWKEFEANATSSRQNVEGANIMPGSGSTPSIADVESFKQIGFSTKDIPYLRLRYERWFKEHYVPSVRRVAAQKSVAARKNKRAGP